MAYKDRIKELREDNDLTQTDIAKVLGTDQSYYAKYENGKHPLPIQHLISLCNYYRVSADYILGLNKGLNWPREEGNRKTYNTTKYSFLLRSRAHSDLRTMCVDLMRPLSLQTTSDGGLPKIVIVTR